VIGTQGGGKPEITSRSRIFVRISGIDISTFLLTRSRVLHIRSSEIVKREIPLEERFDISAFRDPDLEETVIWNREFRTPGSRNPGERKPFRHFGNSGSGRYRR
jgi:hypothetical protein